MAGLLALLAKAPKTPDDAEADDDMGGDARTMAAESLMSALKKGDAGAVADAFGALMQHCGGEPEGDEATAGEE